jgi:hypothetical protein
MWFFWNYRGLEFRPMVLFVLVLSEMVLVLVLSETVLVLVLEGT